MVIKWKVKCEFWLAT